MAGWGVASGRRSAACSPLPLEGHGRSDSPFADEVPAVDARGAHWVDPVLVVDVDTHRTARAQRLRQPSYQGLRRDLNPDDI